MYVCTTCTVHICTVLKYKYKYTVLYNKNKKIQDTCHTVRHLYFVHMNVHVHVIPVHTYRKGYCTVLFDQRPLKKLDEAVFEGNNLFFDIHMCIFFIMYLHDTQPFLKMQAHTHNKTIILKMQAQTSPTSRKKIKKKILCGLVHVWCGWV